MKLAHGQSVNLFYKRDLGRRSYASLVYQASDQERHTINMVVSDLYSGGFSLLHSLFVFSVLLSLFFRWVVLRFWHSFSSVIQDSFTVPCKLRRYDCLILVTGKLEPYNNPLINNSQSGSLNVAVVYYFKTVLLCTSV